MLSHVRNYYDLARDFGQAGYFSDGTFRADRQHSLRNYVGLISAMGLSQDTVAARVQVCNVT
jgi:hypothetical protein